MHGHTEPQQSWTLRVMAFEPSSERKRRVRLDSYWHLLSKTVVTTRSNGEGSTATFLRASNTQIVEENLAR
jgi:hypothetical protein